MKNDGQKSALITGITGQDGAYLAKYLLDSGYLVHGIKRRSSILNTQRVDHLYEDPHNEEVQMRLHYGDLTDSLSLLRLIEAIQPDEIYNLGAQSHVKVSFESPEYTANVDALGTLRILESIRILGLEKKTRFYQASTSELYGKVQETPQTEKTPFYPRSPYAVAKLYSYWTTVNYREAYGMFAVNGILFNHESPQRGETFVTRKITRAASRIVLGLQREMFLGNLSAKRDWGHAQDYVKAMHLMLQVDEPKDFVIATGETYEVRTFLQKSFKRLGIETEFSGSGKEEICVISAVDSKRLDELEVRNYEDHLYPGKKLVSVDQRYFRPTEVDLLVGDASKAREELNWAPKFDLDSTIADMVDSDLSLMKKEKYLSEMSR